jgi:hypothetical protein
LKTTATSAPCTKAPFHQYDEAIGHMLAHAASRACKISRTSRRAAAREPTFVCTHPTVADSPVLLTADGDGIVSPKNQK